MTNWPQFRKTQKQKKKLNLNQQTLIHFTVITKLNAV